MHFTSSFQPLHMRFAFGLGSCSQGGASPAQLWGKAGACWATHSSGILHLITSLQLPVVNTNATISLPWLHLGEARRISHVSICKRQGHAGLEQTVITLTTCHPARTTSELRPLHERNQKKHHNGKKRRPIITAGRGLSRIDLSPMTLGLWNFSGKAP